MATGLITRLLGGFYRVVDERGTIHETRARGKFRHRAEAPVVGDVVEFVEQSGEEIGWITKIHPRKNFLLRPGVSNVDQVLLLITPIDPVCNVSLTDRLLTRYACEGIDVRILINKANLDPEGAQKLRERFEAIGYEVYVISLLAEDAKDLVRPLLNHKKTALAGVSGAGKSTLTSLVVEADVQTSHVSEKTRRGRHTTRHNEIFLTTDGDFLFDTPGFSSLDLEDFDSEEIQEGFIEFRPYEGLCRFKDCLHLKEPGCAIQEAVEEGSILSDRYEEYKTIVSELKEKEKRKW